MSVLLFLFIYLFSFKPFYQKHSKQNNLVYNPVRLTWFDLNLRTSLMKVLECL